MGKHNWHGRTVVEQFYRNQSEAMTDDEIIEAEERVMKQYEKDMRDKLINKDPRSL